MGRAAHTDGPAGAPLHQIEHADPPASLHPALVVPRRQVCFVPGHAVLVLDAELTFALGPEVVESGLSFLRRGCHGVIVARLSRPVAIPPPLLDGAGHAGHDQGGGGWDGEPPELHPLDARVTTAA